MKNVTISACEGGRIAIFFSFDAEILASVKSIKGRRYHNEKEKFWSVPRTTEIFRSLLNILDGHNIRVDLSLQDYYQQYQKKEINRINNSIILKMSDELKLRGYSHKSSKAYLGHIFQGDEFEGN